MPLVACIASTTDDDVYCNYVVSYKHDGKGMAGLDFVIDDVIRQGFGKSIFKESRRRYGLIFFDRFDTTQIQPSDTIFGLFMPSSNGSNYALRSARASASNTIFHERNIAVKRTATGRDTLLFPSIEAMPVWPKIKKWDIDGMQNTWGKKWSVPRNIEYIWMAPLYAVRVLVKKGRIDGIGVLRLYYCFADEKQLEFLKADRQ